MGSPVITGVSTSMRMVECGRISTVDAGVRVEVAGSSTLLRVLAMVNVVFPQTVPNVMDKIRVCLILGLVRFELL